MHVNIELKSENLSRSLAVYYHLAVVASYLDNLYELKASGCVKAWHLGS